MVNKEKKEISVFVFEIFDVHDLLSGPLDVVVEKIKNIPKMLGTTQDLYSRFEIEPNIWGDSPNLAVYGFRLETDDENRRRILREEKYELMEIERKQTKEARKLFLLEQKETNERKLLEELKLKYESNK